MSAHTEGDWTFELDDDGITDVKAVVFVKDHQPGRAEIAHVEAQPQVEANARLISAAPQLLAAVKRAFAIEDSTTMQYEKELRVGYRALLIAAIRKAEGHE